MARKILRNDQWNKLKDLLPGKATDCGVTARDNRQFLEAVLWIMRTGALWRDLPDDYGRWHRVYMRFSRWAKKGIWLRVADTIATDPDFEWVAIDSTIVRAQTCRGRKRGQQNQALGRSRGGLSTKIHILVDALGNPVRVLLTGRQAADVTQGPTLLAELRGMGRCWRIKPMMPKRSWMRLPSVGQRRSFRQKSRGASSAATTSIELEQTLNASFNG